MSAHDTCLWYPASQLKKVWRSCVGVIHFERSDGICPDCGRPYELDKPKDQAEGLRELVKDLNNMRDFMVRPPIDKAALWDALKSELEVEAIGPAESQSLRYKTIGGFGPSRARATLDRMLQMETLANVRPPR